MPNGYASRRSSFVVNGSSTMSAIVPETALDASGQRAAIEGHALGAARDDGAKALELELVERCAIGGLGGAIPDHMRDASALERLYGPPLELSRVQNRSRCVGSWSLGIERLAGLVPATVLHPRERLLQELGERREVGLLAHERRLEVREAILQVAGRRVSRRSISP